MDVLNKLTIKSLKLNKRRTIVTIIGIMLSTALICAIAGMVASFRYTVLAETISDHGDYDVLFANVEAENLTFIRNNRQVSDYQVTQGLGYARLEGSKNLDKPYLYIMAFDEQALENTGLKLVEGRMPQNGNELVISQHISTNGKVAYHTGDTLTLEAGQRILGDGAAAGQETPFSFEEELGDSAFSKTYTVVGIVERPNFKIETYSAPGYTVITALEEEADAVNVYVNYKQENKYKEITKDIYGMLLEKQGETFEVLENETVLRWKGLNLSEGNVMMLYSVGAIVIGIVIISSIFVIRNSFAISVTERFKQYGMLASVGATSRQIRKNILFEGFILGVISIPLGILSGIAAIVVLIWLVNLIMGKYLYGIHFLYSVPVSTLLLSAGLAAITIYFSVLSSARKASKVSPIDAIRNSQEIRISRKKVRTPKLIRKCFRTGGDIAYKNLKRSRRKYRVTVVSLVVSISIFLAISSLIQYGFAVSSVYYNEIGYNLIFRLYDDENPENVYRTYKEISKFHNVGDYSIIRESGPFTYHAYELTEFGMRVNAITDTADTGYLQLRAVGEEEYGRYVKKIGSTVSDCEKGAIIVNKTTVYDDGKYITDNIFDVKAGDVIKAWDEESGKAFEIPVVKITDTFPMGLENFQDLGGILIVSDSWLEQFDEINIGGMFISSDNAVALEEDIHELTSNTRKISETAAVSISNLEENAKAENSMVLTISIFLYGFITVVTLIGVTNIFNTITTNMNLRAKEFAMLKSVGMTTKEFNRMTRLESLFYGVQSLMIGIPIGLGLGYLIHRAVGSGMEMNYVFPLKPITICIIFVMVIVGITMRYSMKKINKSNIIETIRNDNI